MTSVRWLPIYLAFCGLGLCIAPVLTTPPRVATSRTQPAKTGRPHTHIVVLDASGSMYEHDTWPQVTRALGELAATLPPPDRLAIVLFEDRARVVLEGTGGMTAPAVQALLGRVQPMGGSNLHAGVELALDLAQRETRAELLILTDGRPNVGRTTEAAFLALAGRSAAMGVRIHAVSLGDIADTPVLAAMAQTTGGTQTHALRPTLLGESFERISRGTHEVP